jgi:hypothetical protein
MPNIRSAESYQQSWWDWIPYNECFAPTRIRITDVDGLVERNGHFLLVETKGNGVPIPTGQQILFNHLIEDKRWHVLIVWGETDSPTQFQLWGKPAIYAADVAILKNVFRRWFAYANALKGGTR